MATVSRYLESLRLPQIRRLLLGATMGRLAVAMQLVALALFVRDRTDSYAVTGLVTAAFTVGNGILTPLQGRLVDRHGASPVLWPLAVMQCASVGALVVTGLTAPHTVVLVACGFATGIFVPPTSAVGRQRLVGATSGHRSLMPAIFAVDSLLTELMWISGPLLAAAIIAVASPAAALIVAAALHAAAVIGLLATPGRRLSSGSVERHLLGALRSQGMRTIVAVMVPFGFSYGSLQVAIIAFADEVDAPSSAAWLFALLSVGGVAGALTYGAMGSRISSSMALLTVMLISPALSLPLVFADTLLAMAPLLALAGVALTPFLAITNHLVAYVAPPDAVTEAYAWPYMAMLVGVAIGLMVAGPIVDRWGAQAGFAMIIVAATVNGAIALARRWTLPNAAAHEPAPVSV